MAISKTQKKEEKQQQPIKKNDGSLSHYKNSLSEIIVRPHVSEKSLEMEKERKYVFQVIKNANKKQVKDAVEKLYGVNVVSINVINVPKKKKKLGRHSGWKKGYRKAIVALKENEKIDITVN